MITEKEVQRAIEECLQEPVTSNKRGALADLIIIQDYLFGEPPTEREQMQMPVQSFDMPPKEPVEKVVEAYGDSEFLTAVNGKNADKAWRLVDELVEAVKILHPRMYNAFVEKVRDL